MRAFRQVAAGIAAVAFGVTAAVWVFSGNSTPSVDLGASALSDGGVSLLDRPASAADRLPPSVSQSAMARQLDVESARLAQMLGASKQFVVRGKDDSVICQVIVATTSTIQSCGGSAMLNNGAIYLMTPHVGGTMDVYGIVGDGVIRVNRTRVHNNTFAFTGKASQTITLSTVSQTRPFSLGPIG